MILAILLIVMDFGGVSEVVGASRTTDDGITVESDQCYAEQLHQKSARAPSAFPNHAISA